MEKEMSFAERLGFDEHRLTVEEVMELEATQKPNNWSKYTRMWRDFMIESNPLRTSEIKMSGQWIDYMQAVEKDVRDLEEILERNYRRTYPRPKDNYMETVRYETQLRMYVEEIILDQIVYKPR